MQENILFKKYQKNNLPEGYIKKADCINFINEAVNNGFFIIGVEGLCRKQGNIEPNFDEIFDFSNAKIENKETIVNDILKPFFLFKAKSDIYDFTIIKTRCAFRELKKNSL